MNFDLRESSSASTDEQWKPFTSRQRVVTRSPDFLRDAQVSMFPGVAVRVVDSYIAGEVASSKIRIGGFFSGVSMAYYGRCCPLRGMGNRIIFVSMRSFKQTRSHNVPANY